ncbi:CMRF35-like molecule 5 [Carassius carassius]|uniref:CMRF35-like molecule 5 n=1 Tax=Carassius carassius TaxID=217509 RepID=UPI002868C4F7|nr:CMRF35-like molecule 5 [Carassius carassius]
MQICDDKLLIFQLLLLVSVMACETSEILTFTAHEGGKVEIQCPYEAKYEEYKKYLCRGECPIVIKDKLIESESAAKDKRFSLSDNKTTHIFTVTITDLRTEDRGQYWCGVKTGFGSYDYKREIYLEIKHERMSPKPSATTASFHTNKPVTADTESDRTVTSSSSSSSSVLMLFSDFTSIVNMSVMGILMVFGFLLLIYNRFRRKKEAERLKGDVLVLAEYLSTKEATHAVCHYEEIVCTDNHSGYSLGLPVFDERDSNNTLAYSTVIYQSMGSVTLSP